VPQIAGLLARNRFGKEDIGGFAVVSGPGSFTGLRVGLAVVKALAEVLDKPVAAVSLLEAVAASGSARGNVMAAVDAGRSQVYAGEYEVDDQQARVRGERLLTLPELIGSAAGSIVVTPDSSLAEALRAAALQVELIEPPRAGAIARLGWRKIQIGETISPLNLDANYIRRSDAEIFGKSIP
jgi:tRNA threonylcarbamoyladenosine biosynthesis protein TsaB